MRIASAAARALIVAAAAGAVDFGGRDAIASAQQRLIDPNDRFAARPDEPDLDAAIQIDRWLEATAVKLEDGWAWPAVPDDWAGRAVPAESLDTSLYSGSAGVVLFGLELARATAPFAPDSGPFHSSPFLEMPEQAAKHLLATLPKDRIEGDGEGCGLYTGIAGVGFALFQFGRATNQIEAQRGARRCVELLAASAHVAGSGIEWGDCTDLISGGAGIGLFLIHMAEQDHDPLARELAIRAGRRLLELGEREETGRSWRMTPTFPRVMPNFSHGTAGVAFFLARLYELTADGAFLDGALDGARHVLSLADTSNGGCRIFHHSNDTDEKDDASGRALHYLGWCHGPVGTAQLFMKLAQVSGDPDWTDRVLMSAKAVRDSGIPEHATPGFWNNVSVCCGSTGVASFFETLARARTTSIDLGSKVPGDDPDHVFARRCFEWTLARGTRDEHGLRFPQAEHRVKPELVQAQVGLMQGTAGVGLTLLRIARSPHEVATGLPDDPTSTQFGSMLRATLYPAAPSAEPNATTTAFENLGRGVMFAGASRRSGEGPDADTARDAAPKPVALDSWFDAARDARAKYAVLHTGVVDPSGDAEPIAEFVRVARARGVAVGLSTSLGRPPGEGQSPYEWTKRAQSGIARLLTAFGPISLLRIEVPRDFEEWAHLAGNKLYRAAKIVAPHTLVEFVSSDLFRGGERGENGVQRLGAKPSPYHDDRYEGGRAPRREELWPTDVVAGFDDGPVEARGFVGPYLRPLPSPVADGPWRLVDGRRFYVPLQIELPLGPFERKLPHSPPPKSKVPPPGSDNPVHDFGIQLQSANQRAPNVLVVVTVEADGRLSPKTLVQLHELGAR
jgi:hypothetical protein